MSLGDDNEDHLAVCAVMYVVKRAVRLAEARDLRKRVMSRKSTVRKVKFSSDEIAFEGRADYSNLKFKRREVRNLVELDPDLAAFYRTAEAVNNALRKVMEALPEQRQPQLG